METTFEEMEKRRLDQEERRLDLAEREIVNREKALEAEGSHYQKGIDSQIADRAERRAQRETEHSDWQTHRKIVEEGNREHGALLDRIATALERMAEAGATIR